MRSLAIIAVLALGACGQGADAPPTTPDVDPNLAMNTALVQHQCSNCHASDYARVGPAMKDVATVLSPQTAETTARLKAAILQGSKGKWGEAIMPPQAQVSPAQADELVKAIFATAPKP